MLRILAEACTEENGELLDMVEPGVKTVLTAFGTKNVALMRELAYVCGSRDIASPSLLLLGIPMMGWAPVAEGLMERSKPPEISVEEFLADRHARNDKLLQKVRPSSDAALDLETFDKTTAEVERGVLVGPFHSTAEIPFTDFALLPRHGIWEQHGDADTPSCRGIDDMLQGGHNPTVGTASAHRPTDPDGLVAQVRAVRRRYSSSRLMGWPCDLEKAYK